MTDVGAKRRPLSLLPLALLVLLLLSGAVVCAVSYVVVGGLPTPENIEYSCAGTSENELAPIAKWVAKFPNTEGRVDGYAECDSLWFPSVTSSIRGPVKIAERYARIRGCTSAVVRRDDPAPREMVCRVRETWFVLTLVDEPYDHRTEIEGRRIPSPFR